MKYYVYGTNWKGQMFNKPEGVYDSMDEAKKAANIYFDEELAEDEGVNIVYGGECLEYIN